VILVRKAAVRFAVSSEYSIYAAVVSIDIAGAVAYSPEDLPGLHDSYTLTPLPSVFFGLRAFQWTSTGVLANTLTKI
jgi:hypothetical protein